MSDETKTFERALIFLDNIGEDLHAAAIRAHLAAKDAEIERLTRERDEFRMGADSEAFLGDADRIDANKRIADLVRENAELRATRHTADLRWKNCRQRAIDAERERDALKARLGKAIDEEPELPGDIPEELYRTLRDADRETMAETLRIVVRETKDGIRARLAEQESR